MKNTLRFLTTALALVAIPIFAADVKISELPAASSVSTTDTAVIVQSGTTKKAAISLIVAADAELATWSAIAPGTGVGTFLATPTSANLAAAITNETGTGLAVFGTSPTLITPILGTPTSGTLTNCTIPTAGISDLGTGVATFLTTPTSANLAAALTNETGTGLAVFATSPTLVTPLLGTPTSGTLTSCTGLPISTGVSGLGTGVATFAATPSSANLAAALTDETGSGAAVFATSPTLVTPALGAATATSLNVGSGTTITKIAITSVAAAAPVSPTTTNTQNVAVAGLVAGDGLAVCLNKTPTTGNVLTSIQYLSAGNAKVILHNTHADDEADLVSDSVSLIITHFKK